MMIGEHCIRSWSTTQKSVTLSSGEAELVALVKLSTEVIGLTQMARDWGLEMFADIYVDSAAAIGVVKRQGNGKLRHIKVGQLWVQEKAESGELAYKKVDGQVNPADVLTKYISESRMETLCENLNVHGRSGRAEKGLNV